MFCNKSLLRYGSLDSIGRPEGKMLTAFSLKTKSITELFIVYVSYITGPPEDFYYTNQGEDAYIDNVDDAALFQDTREAMELLGIYSESQRMMFRVLAAILHLGNIQINQSENKEDETQVEVWVITVL